MGQSRGNESKSVFHNIAIQTHKDNNASIISENKI